MKRLLILSLLLSACSLRVGTQATPTVTLKVISVPTATPIVCPTPVVCPTVLYKILPDPAHELENLELAMISVEKAKEAMEEIMASEGDYNSRPHILAIVAINHLNNAFLWTDSTRNAIYGWQQSNLLTCVGGQ